MADQETPPEKAARIRDVLDDCLRRRLAGEHLADDAIVAAHPDLLPELAEELRKLALIQQAGRAAEYAPTVNDDSAHPASPVGTRPVPPSLPSDSFAGYKLLREIHRGGQGVVYQALQKSTKRKVAIKVMKEGPFAGPAERARFEREVQVLGQLQHPNIVAIHDSGSAAGCFYFVMDYIAGQPLEVYMASGTRSVEETLKLFAKICEAVNAAHLRGVIHRDLKPGNIRIDANGEPRILDFGLAKVSAFNPIVEGGSPVMTVTGQFVGSLPWASPEQAEGMPSKIDVRTDVYSLGVVLYQMLTGKFPYEVVGNMRDVLDRIMKTEPAKPSTIRKQINDEVETIVLKCLSKERDRRYQTAGELARDIGHYLAGEPVEAKRDSTLYLLRKQLRRYRVPLMIVLGFVVLVMASSIVAWALYARSQASLWESYLAQARAQRFTGRPGRRVEALATIAKATAMRPSQELRNEAIAGLALTDVQIKRIWPSPVKSEGEMEYAFDSTLTNYFIADRRGKTLSVRRVSDSAEVFRLPEGADRKRETETQFSADGRYLVFGVSGGVEVWDISRQQLADRIPVQGTRSLSPLGFSPDGLALAIGTQDGTVVRYELGSKQLYRFPPVHAPVHRVVFSPDSSLIATSSLSSNDVVIRDAESGAVTRTLTHPDILWSLAWSPDGRLLAVGCQDNRIYVWNAATGDCLFTLSKHISVPINLAFDDSGSLLLSTGWDSTTRLWDLRTGEQELVLSLLAWSFKRGGAEFAFCTGLRGSSFGIAEIVRSDSYRELIADRADRSRGPCRRVAISPNGRLAASTTDAGWWLWDLAIEREIAFLPGAPSLDCITFDASGSAVFTASESGVQSWKLQRQGETIRVGEPEVLIAGYGGEAINCAATRDGRRVVAVASDGFIYVHELGGTEKETKIGPHRGGSNIDVSPDNRWVASGAHHGRDVKVWDLQTGALVKELSFPGWVGVAFSPDGRWLVTGAAEHIFWDTQMWRARARLPWRGYMGGPSNIAFSPDSSYVAVSGEPGIIQLIETRTFKVVADLECPQAIPGLSFAFSPDGARLIVDNPTRSALQVWDLRAVRKHLAEMDLDWDFPP